MIQSPWEQATALVTTEREGVRSHRQFALTSTQQSISIPVTDDDIPNVFVSVLLVKGRGQAETKAAEPTATRQNERFGTAGPNVVEDPSDPGKPAFRLGYVELNVEDASKRLKVSVRADKEEYRPANAAKVLLDVKDASGRGAPSEVTLWAVDYGVLSLTAYRTPDVLGSVYVHKALQVMNADNRQRIISRRVLTPKGETEGGGGGADAGAGTLRKDFRVLAFWLGSVTTDEYGKGSIEVKLPESLTTYRIMAVAADRSSRFGSSDAEVRINKPLTLKPTFPRFLALGDKAYFGAVVTSQLKTAGAATVTIASLDPDVLEFAAGAQQTLQVAAGGSIEARFDAAGKQRRSSPRADDGQDRGRDGCLRGCHPGRAARVSGDGRRIWRGHRRERDRDRNADDSRERRARSWRPPCRAVVDGDGRARRRRAVSRRVSVRLRRAARVADAGAGAGRRSRRRVLAAGHGHRKDAAVGAAEPEGAREISVRRWRASSYWPGDCTYTLALPHRLSAARVQDRCRPEIPGRRRDARARLRLPRARARRRTSDQRRLVAVLHRLAGVCRQGAGRRRAQPGLEPHPALRLSRADAGVRPRLPPRCLRRPRGARRVGA